MRIPASLLIALLAAAIGRANPIRHEHIPADAVGYVHVDIDRFLSSGLCREMAGDIDAAAVMKAQMGGQIRSFTVYSVRREGTVRVVVLVSGDQALRRRVEALAAKAKDSVVLRIGDQEVHYAASPQFLLQAVDAGPHEHVDPEPEIPEPVRKWRPSFSMGFGGDGDDFQNWAIGPSYIAFVGQDLILATVDLRTMADALDVLTGKKPSLAAQDPQGLKWNADKGAMLLGAGITAYVSANTLSPEERRIAATQPAQAAGGGAGGFDLDLFGSLKGKARLAHFDIGEDERSVYVNVTVGMSDAESATQLKNLALGVKALIAFSQVKQQALINPLDVQATGQDVIVHWSWPVANLSGLARMIKTGEDAQPSRPTSIRTSSSTQPTGGAR